MSRSSDGGRTWSAPATPMNNNTGVIGGQPVVRPDGTVVVPIVETQRDLIVAFNSTNGGYEAGARGHHDRDHPPLTRSRGEPARGGRCPVRGDRRAPGPSTSAWTDCRFRRSFARPTTSCSATRSTPPARAGQRSARVPIDATNSNVDHFTPAWAVNKARLGGERAARLYVLLLSLFQEHASSASASSPRPNAGHQHVDNGADGG